MNSNINESSIMLKKVEKDFKLKVLFLASLINEYIKHNKNKSKDDTIQIAQLTIARTLNKAYKLSSSEYFYQKTGISLKSISSGVKMSKPNIVKLCNTAVNSGVIADNRVNSFLLNITLALKREMQSLEDQIKRLEKKLSVFYSSDEKKQSDSDVFIDLLKKLNKIPTVEALALSTHNRISKSKWDRNLKNDRFLYFLIGKIETLINRTKDSNRIEFYTSVHTIFSNKLESALNKKSIYRKVFQSRNKNIKINESNTDDTIREISDNKQYNDWISDNY